MGQNLTTECSSLCCFLFTKAKKHTRWRHLGYLLSAWVQGAWRGRACGLKFFSVHLWQQQGLVNWPSSDVSAVHPLLFQQPAAQGSPVLGPVFWHFCPKQISSWTDPTISVTMWTVAPPRALGARCVKCLLLLQFCHQWVAFTALILWDTEQSLLIHYFCTSYSKPVTHPPVTSEPWFTCNT